MARCPVENTIAWQNAILDPDAAFLMASEWSEDDDELPVISPPPLKTEPQTSDVIVTTFHLDAHTASLVKSVPPPSSPTLPFEDNGKYPSTEIVPAICEQSSEGNGTAEFGTSSCFTTLNGEFEDNVALWSAAFISGESFEQTSVKLEPPDIDFSCVPVDFSVLTNSEPVDDEISNPVKVETAVIPGSVDIAIQKALSASTFDQKQRELSVAAADSVDPRESRQVIPSLRPRLSLPQSGVSDTSLNVSAHFNEPAHYSESITGADIGGKKRNRRGIRNSNIDKNGTEVEQLHGATTIRRSLRSKTVARAKPVSYREIDDENKKSPAGSVTGSLIASDHEPSGSEWEGRDSDCDSSTEESVSESQIASDSEPSGSEYSGCDSDSSDLFDNDGTNGRSKRVAKRTCFRKKRRSLRSKTAVSAMSYHKTDDESGNSSEEGVTGSLNASDAEQSGSEFSGRNSENDSSDMSDDEGTNGQSKKVAKKSKPVSAMSYHKTDDESGNSSEEGVTGSLNASDAEQSGSEFSGRNSENDSSVMSDDEGTNGQSKKVAKKNKRKKLVSAKPIPDREMNDKSEQSPEEGVIRSLIASDSEPSGSEFVGHDSDRDSSDLFDNEGTNVQTNKVAKRPNVLKKLVSAKPVFDQESNDESERSLEEGVIGSLIAADLEPTGSEWAGRDSDRDSSDLFDNEGTNGQTNKVTKRPNVLKKLISAKPVSDQEINNESEQSLEEGVIGSLIAADPEPCGSEWAGCDSDRDSSDLFDDEGTNGRTKEVAKNQSIFNKLASAKSVPDCEMCVESEQAPEECVTGSLIASDPEPSDSEFAGRDSDCDSSDLFDDEGTNRRTNKVIKSRRDLKKLVSDKPVSYRETDDESNNSSEEGVTGSLIASDPEPSGSEWSGRDSDFNSSDLSDTDDSNGQSKKVTKRPIVFNKQLGVRWSSEFYRTATDHPPLSMRELLRLFLSRSNRQEVLFDDIRNWLCTNFGYYRQNATVNWNEVHAELKLLSSFTQPRTVTDTVTGKGSSDQWCQASAVDLTLAGNSSRSRVASSAFSNESSDNTVSDERSRSSFLVSTITSADRFVPEIRLHVPPGSTVVFETTCKTSLLSSGHPVVPNTSVPDHRDNLMPTDHHPLPRVASGPLTKTSEPKTTTSSNYTKSSDLHLMLRLLAHIQMGSQPSGTNIDQLVAFNPSIWDSAYYRKSTAAPPLSIRTLVRCCFEEKKPCPLTLTELKQWLRLNFVYFWGIFPRRCDAVISVLLTCPCFVATSAGSVIRWSLSNETMCELCRKAADDDKVRAARTPFVPASLCADLTWDRNRYRTSAERLPIPCKYVLRQCFIESRVNKLHFCEIRDWLIANFLYYRQQWLKEQLRVQQTLRAHRYFRRLDGEMRNMWMFDEHCYNQISACNTNDSRDFSIPADSVQVVAMNPLGSPTCVEEVAMTEQQVLKYPEREYSEESVKEMNNGIKEVVISIDTAVSIEEAAPIVFVNNSAVEHFAHLHNDEVSEGGHVTFQVPHNISDVSTISVDSSVPKSATIVQSSLQFANRQLASAVKKVPVMRSILLKKFPKKTCVMTAELIPSIKNLGSGQAFTADIIETIAPHPIASESVPTQQSSLQCVVTETSLVAQEVPKTRNILLTNLPNETCGMSADSNTSPKDSDCGQSFTIDITEAPGSVARQHSSSVAQEIRMTRSILLKKKPNTEIATSTGVPECDKSAHADTRKNSDLPIDSRNTLLRREIQQGENNPGSPSGSLFSSEEGRSSDDSGSSSDDSENNDSDSSTSKETTITNPTTSERKKLSLPLCMAELADPVIRRFYRKSTEKPCFPIWAQVVQCISESPGQKADFISMYRWLVNNFKYYRNFDNSKWGIVRCDIRCHTMFLRKSEDKNTTFSVRQDLLSNMQFKASHVYQLRQLLLKLNKFDEDNSNAVGGDCGVEVIDQGGERSKPKKSSSSLRLREDSSILSRPISRSPVDHFPELRKDIYRTSPERPPFPYQAFIRQALVESAEGLNIDEIRLWLSERFMFYRQAPAVVRRGILGSLAIRYGFVRHEVPGCRLSRWTVDDKRYFSFKRISKNKTLKANVKKVVTKNTKKCQKINNSDSRKRKLSTTDDDSCFERNKNGSEGEVEDGPNEPPVIKVVKRKKPSGNKRKLPTSSDSVISKKRTTNSEAAESDDDGELKNPPTKRRSLRSVAAAGDKRVSYAEANSANENSGSDGGAGIAMDEDSRDSEWSACDSQPANSESSGDEEIISDEIADKTIGGDLSADTQNTSDTFNSDQENSILSVESSTRSTDNVEDVPKENGKSCKSAKFTPNEQLKLWASAQKKILDDFRKDLKKNGKLYKKKLEKPPFSYKVMLIHALKRAPKEQLTVNQVCDWVCKRFRYFRESAGVFRLNMKNVMSADPCFRNVSKEVNGLWTLDHVALVKWRVKLTCVPNPFDRKQTTLLLNPRLDYTTQLLLRKIDKFKDFTSRAPPFRFIDLIWACLVSHGKERLNVKAIAQWIRRKLAYYRGWKDYEIYGTTKSYLGNHAYFVRHADGPADDPYVWTFDEKEKFLASRDRNKLSLLNGVDVPVKLNEISTAVPVVVVNDSCS